MENDYIAHCIHCFPQKSTQYFPEYAGFSFIEQSENSTFIRFDCNRKCFDMKLLKHCSPYFTKKVLPSIKDRPLGIKGICEKYLDTDKKMMLFVFSLCGLLSSFFREEKYSLNRILIISAPDAASERFATFLMQIFNRGTKPLTLCSKSLFSISSRTSFRQILPIAALKKLTIRQYAFTFSPCTRQNYARKSARAEILNRL